MIDVKSLADSGFVTKTGVVDNPVAQNLSIGDFIASYVTKTGCLDKLKEYEKDTPTPTPGPTTCHLLASICVDHSTPGNVQYIYAGRWGEILCLTEGLELTRDAADTGDKDRIVYSGEFPIGTSITLQAVKNDPAEYYKNYNFVAFHDLQDSGVFDQPNIVVLDGNPVTITLDSEWINLTAVISQ